MSKKGKYEKFNKRQFLGLSNIFYAIDTLNKGLVTPMLGVDKLSSKTQLLDSN